MKRLQKLLPIVALQTLILTVIFGVLSYKQLQQLIQLIEAHFRTSNINYVHYSTANNPFILEEAGSAFEHRASPINMSRTNDTAEYACAIPELDIFHEDVQQFVHYKEPVKCNIRMISYIENDTLFINESGIDDAGFYYIKRKPGSDFANQLSPWISMFKPSIAPIKEGTTGCLVPLGGTESVLIDSTWFMIAATDECTYLKLLRFEDGLITHFNSRSCLTFMYSDVLAFSHCRPDSVSQKFLAEEEGSVIRHVGTGLCLGLSKRSKIKTALLVDCKEAQRFYMLIHHGKPLSAKLEQEFIMVRMQRGDQSIIEYHAHVMRNPQDSHLLPSSEASPNIAMLMYDSQSTSNIKRNMKVTYGFLRSHHDTFIFEGMTVVGDGTTAQVAAQLTGIPESELPEARRGVKGSETVDKFPFIFQQLKMAGYISALSEDDPKRAAFTYRMNGFHDPPCEKYLQPFWLEALKELDTKEVACSHLLNLNYLRKFFDVYHDVKKFAYITNARCAHDDISRISYADQDTYDVYQYFIQKGYLNNTIFVLFGDHGDRSGGFRATLTGKLEERLPFFAITVPGWFKTKYPTFYENLRNNQKTLTTHFDVYATLRHLIDLQKPPTQYRVGQGMAESLLTEINKSKRTCDSAGIESHWCPCLSYHELSITDQHVVAVATEIVHYINSLLCSDVRSCGACAPFKLTNIIRAGARSPNKDVKAFKSTAKTEQCDSCGVVWNYHQSAAKVFVYELVVQVEPSDGLFESSAEVHFASLDSKAIDRIAVNPEISRVNRYFDQPACIAEHLPHLRNFCYCISKAT